MILMTLILFIYWNKEEGSRPRGRPRINWEENDGGDGNDDDDDDDGGDDDDAL